MFIAGLLIFPGLKAQNSDSLSIKDLEIPASPAFILLDQSPSIIERPNTSKAFVLSILNPLTDISGLPENYAADFTPFWFFRHPGMNQFKYMGYDKTKGKQKIFSNIKKTSVSLAFINQSDSPAGKPVGNFSAGIRTTLLSVRRNQDVLDYLAANAKMVRHLKSLEEKLFEAGIFPPIPADTSTRYLLLKKEYDDKVNRFLADEEQATMNDKNELYEILNRKALFAIDGAAGYHCFFLDNTFSKNHFGKAGVWLTLNYSQPLSPKGDFTKYLNIYGIGRYLSDGTEKENNNYIIQNCFDFGTKIELELKKFSFAYEYIYRKNTNNDEFRSTGILKYKISDQLYITGAFGKNFGSENNLISLLGISWGLTSGTEKVKIQNIQ